MRVHFTVDGRPQAKQRPRFARGHSYTPQKTREAEASVVGAFKAKYFDFVPLSSPLSVTMLFQFKKPKKEKKHFTQRPDVDNLVKTVMDALNGVAWEDDAQIVQLVAQKVYADIEGTLVSIEELT